MTENVFDVSDYGKTISASVNVFKRLFIIYGIDAFLCTAAGIFVFLDPSVTMDIQDSEFAYLFNAAALVMFIIFLTSPVVLFIHTWRSRSRLVYGILNNIYLEKDDGLGSANRACASYAVLSIGIPWSYVVCNYFPSIYSLFLNVTALLFIAEICMITTVPFFLKLFKLKVALLGEIGADANLRLKGIFIPLYMMLYCMIVAFIGVIVVFVGFIFVEPELSEYQNFYLFIHTWF